MRMMEDMHVVENRGSGIKSMLQALRDANLEPPKFDDRRSSFLVTFRNHTLLNPLVEQEGTGRWTSYHLAAWLTPADSPEP